MTTLGLKLNDLAGITPPFTLGVQGITALNIQIAREVTAVLNEAGNGVFPMPFQAVRRYAPVYPIEQLTDLKVTVVALLRDTEFESRELVSETHRVDVCVQKKIANAEDVDELDALMGLSQSIGFYLAGDDAEGKSRRHLPCDASLMKFTYSIPFDPDHLKTKMVYTSVLSLTYESQGAFR